MLKKLNNLTIRSVLLINLILSFLLVFIFCIFIVFSVRQVFRDSLIERGRHEVASWTKKQVDTHISREIFSENDLNKTQESFNSFFFNIDTDEILRIKVWDKNARIIASNDDSIVGLSFPDNALFKKAINGEIVAEIKSPVEPENIKEKGYGQLMEVYVPIESTSGEVIGVIETYTILDNLNKRITDAQLALVFQIMVIAIPFLILISILFWIFYSKIKYKINILKEAAKIIGSGCLDKNINIKQGDELFEIADAINKMCANLSETLVAKNELEKQVAERTKELKERADKIEKINALMIDRELKMIELKKEIKKETKKA